MHILSFLVFRVSGLPLLPGMVIPLFGVILDRKKPCRKFPDTWLLDVMHVVPCR